MKFITARDLRLRPGQVWEQLASEREIVVTSNGKPVALLTGVDEENVEKEILALRRARAQIALDRLRQSARARGLDRLPPKRIGSIIAAVRRRRTR
ncbi:MAG: type II toxin-antitoxin system prevent-host-death family antitoxin [Nitrospirae bacterium]|nr:type II toxin-antitoxin system prevent-host-death family antitoxin [Nitrospirota bacterium]